MSDLTNCDIVDTYWNDSNIGDNTIDLFKTFAGGINFYKTVIGRLIVTDRNEKIFSTTKEWNSNCGLFVIIHGLLGTPMGGTYSIYEEIKNQSYRNYEIRVPYVPKAGNCKIEDAIKPILEMIIDYHLKFPHNKIHLIGTSNGARIAGYIDLELRKYDVNLRITSVAGVFNGSKTMDMINKTGITRLVFDKSVRNDLSLLSDGLISKMKEPIQIGKRFYEFYGTINDFCIPNVSSCFPLLGDHKYIHHKIKSGVGHTVLIHHLREEIIKNSLRWFNENCN